MSTESNILDLHRELDWLESVIGQVIASYLCHEGHENRWFNIPLPQLSQESGYGKLITEWNLDIYERLALSLALAPCIRPEMLDIFLTKNQMYDPGFTEFGGLTDKCYSGFLPTGQTFCFLISATEPQLRLHALRILSSTHKLIKGGLITLHKVPLGIPYHNGLLSINRSWSDFLLPEGIMALQRTSKRPVSEVVMNNINMII